MQERPLLTQQKCHLCPVDGAAMRVFRKTINFREMQHVARLAAFCARRIFLAFFRCLSSDSEVPYNELVMRTLHAIYLRQVRVT